MRKTLVTVFLTLCAFGASAAELPDGWYLIGDQGMAGYQVRVAPDAGINGSGLAVKKLEGTAGSFGGVGQAIAAENYLGKKVRLSGHIRTQSVSDGYAGLWFRVDKGKEMIVLDNMSSRGVMGTSQWQAYETVLYVDPNATRILFGALLTGKGEMFADQLSLDIVPDDTPTTDATSATFLKEPQSLDF